MKTRKLWAGIMLLAGLAFLLQLSTKAKAQDDDEGRDPPGRVARMDYSRGSVSFRPAGEDDWVTAVPNRPIVSGDDLWADEDSRAEIHVGSTAIRLGSRTGITFLAMDDNTLQIRLAQGSLIVRVSHADDDDTYEIDTPNIAFTVLQPGEYRVDVSEDGRQSIVNTWHGRGQVTGGGLSYMVVAGQSATFTGDEQHLDYDLARLPRRDSFDDWAYERDEREDRAESANYVSREMTGYEDLDEYGDWSYVAGYGPCWRPRAVAVGWAPYRFGHWIWVEPWGWTWVEDEPWGFAPFHYGRWAFVGGGWYWVPGPVVVRPVWAPAMVAFVGGSPGFHFSVGVGVGWFPLAPGEVWVPGYRVSRTYVNNVNITNTTVNVTNVTNVYNTVIVNKSTTINNVTYVNQRVNNGVTVVSHDTFVNARPVAQNVMRVEQREVAAAPISHVVAAEPVRASVIGVGRPVSVKPPAPVISRPVVAVRTPPPPPRPIEQRQAAAGGHLNEQQMVRPMPPARPAPVNQGGRPPQQAEPGFRPFGQPSGGNPPVNNSVKPMLRPQPRVYEQQGTPQPEARPEPRNVPQPENRTAPPAENRNVPPPPDNRNVQPPQQNRPAPPENRQFNPPPRQENRPAPPPNEGTRPAPPPREEARPAPPAETHPLVRPTPPVQHNEQQEQQKEEKFRQWQQQRPASPPPQRQEQPRPEPKQSPPPKDNQPPPKPNDR